jgi:hypothetical protein
MVALFQKKYKALIALSPQFCPKRRGGLAENFSNFPLYGAWPYQVYYTKRIAKV